jgi:hypothetical protein
MMASRPFEAHSLIDHFLSVHDFSAAYEISGNDTRTWAQ